MSKAALVASNRASPRTTPNTEDAAVLCCVFQALTTTNPQEPR